MFDCNNINWHIVHICETEFACAYKLILSLARKFWVHNGKDEEKESKGTNALISFCVNLNWNNRLVSRAGGGTDCFSKPRYEMFG